MWISKKKWEALEKRIADLEGQANLEKELQATQSGMELKKYTFVRRDGKVIREAR
ncbi:hypothetical protein [Lacrimispora sp.]|uniref:hypothetical protein n=1 Tax=Lacrimispora sp. TaxID=2719234 RepID=UPI00345F8159